MTRRLPESVETRLLLARRFTYAVQRFRRSKWDFGQRRKDFYGHYWRQAAAEVGASVEDRGAGYFEVRRGSRSLLVQYHLLNLDTYFNKALVDDKAFVRDLVTELGFVSPRSLEYDLSKMAPAFDFLERVAVMIIINICGMQAPLFAGRLVNGFLGKIRQRIIFLLVHYHGHWRHIHV